VTEHEEIITKLAEAVSALNSKLVIELTDEVINNGVDPYVAINEGLAVGMNEVGHKYSIGEYFVPELMLAAKVMNIGVERLKPHIVASEQDISKGRIVLGTVKGDIHNIGKDLVALMWRVSGYEVFDLGIDVAPKSFVDKAEEVSADVVAMSALMTTTMANMREVMDLFRDLGNRDKYKVVIGGAPTSQILSDEIGADGYAQDAAGAVRLVTELLGR
jgi:corrinoid protein of di/trimethylamine methyltransferase